MTIVRFPPHWPDDLAEREASWENDGDVIADGSYTPPEVAIQRAENPVVLAIALIGLLLCAIPLVLWLDWLFNR